MLRLLARGLSNKQIAARLVISPKTVANHTEHIYAKIDASTRAAAGSMRCAMGCYRRRSSLRRPRLGVRPL